ncbi:MAG: U32 family peptidase, partial [Planctomycetales bacterium]|nr:U32 family peptidase [Planctomycetales bacterium]
QKYLLSPQDLAAYDLIPQLVEAGVAAFKIEGRLKTPEYVANITSHYRQAIDAAVAKKTVHFSPSDVAEMEMSFSRGFSHGWLDGNDHKALVPALSSAKRGVRLGSVVASRGDRVRVELAAAVAPGDGVVFQGDRASGQEQGGRVYEVFQRGRKTADPVSGGAVELAFARDSIDFSRLHAGQAVWKTDDPKLTARWRKTFSGADPVRRVDLDLAIVARANQPLRVDAVAASGARCSVASEQPLAPALRHPLTEATLREQFGRLGASVYRLRSVRAEIDSEVMLPLSVLGAMRREMLAQLDESLRPAASPVVSARKLADLRAEATIAQPEAATPPRQPQLHALCRNLAQLQSALDEQAAEIYVDFADIRQCREAVAMAREHTARLWLATPRIQKPDEMGIFRSLEKHGAHGWLVRNLAGMQFCRDRAIPLVVDFSLNVANVLTFDLLARQGAARITASYDMNREQLLHLVQSAPAADLEVVVHQHMPMFHMEHCVFCAVLSPGTNKSNCGRPCDEHAVQLRDHIGMEHRLTADVGCRNTLFNAVAQSAAEAVPQLQARGVVHFRVEFLDESPPEIAATLSLYRRLLAGEVAGREVWSNLQAMNRVGVTRGTLEARRDPLALL